MNEEDTSVKIARLEEQLRAAEKALQLAQSNAHIIMAQILSIIAIVVSAYTVFKR